MSTTITKGATTIIPLQVLGYESTQTTGNVLHDIIGRSDFDVTFAAAGLRSGTLTFLFDSLASAQDAAAVHASVGKQDLDDTDLPLIAMTYVASGSIVVAQDDDGLFWTVAVDYQEVV